MSYFGFIQATCSIDTKEIGYSVPVKYYVHCVQCLLLDRHGGLTGEAFIFFLRCRGAYQRLKRERKPCRIQHSYVCHHLYAPSSIEGMIDRGERDP